MDFVDELWVPNQCNADYARGWGYDGDIRIFPHGIDPRYNLENMKKPLPTGRLEVVNIGHPAIRKQSRELAEAWGDSEYANSRDASLTIKTYATAKVRAEEDFKGLKNVNIVAKDFMPEEYIKFLNNFNVMVYPSYGEGFGLMPLETMAMGIPTIVPGGGWCDYSYIQERFNVPWRLGPAPGKMGQKYHPGEVFLPDMDEVFRQIKNIESDLPGSIDYARSRAGIASKEYDWMTLTEKHFAQYDLDKVW
jgi:glycosyltransferase involved in cell wall biosynthesis